MMQMVMIVMITMIMMIIVNIILMMMTRIMMSRANGRAWGEGENREHYSNQLSGQVVEKREVGRRSEEFENLQQEQHHKAWQTFWGRPGYGAPRNSLQKENLMKMLHFQDVSQVPNHIELVTLERLPVV